MSGRELAHVQARDHVTDRSTLRPARGSGYDDLVQLDGRLGQEEVLRCSLAGRDRHLRRGSAVADPLRRQSVHAVGYVDEDVAPIAPRERPDAGPGDEDLRGSQRLTAIRARDPTDDRAHRSDSLRLGSRGSIRAGAGQTQRRDGRQEALYGSNAILDREEIIRRPVQLFDRGWREEHDLTTELRVCD